MFRPVRIVLDRLAERCLAMAAGMLETTVKSLQIAHEAERQHELEELARNYEAEGLTLIANTLRERASDLLADPPATGSEALLQELAASVQSYNSAEVDRLPGASQSTAATPPSRRLKSRAERAKPTGAVPEVSPPAAAGSELFFPLTPNISATQKADQPE